MLIWSPFQRRFLKSSTSLTIVTRFCLETTHTSSLRDTSTKRIWPPTPHRRNRLRRPQRLTARNQKHPRCQNRPRWTKQRKFELSITTRFARSLLRACWRIPVT